ncbi:hypothetical protein, partial [Bartonella tribocorum]|uniref:hypothetical protein n=1 Tax=Bartonella tribocorum TaxID=85701 RepID=UPI001ABA9D60
HPHLFDLREIPVPYIAYCFTIVIGNTMHETASPYKSDSVSQKSISQKSTLFPIILLVRETPVLNHPIKSFSKALQRR